MCFSERKATKRAKYLRYTLNFKDPCIELILALRLLELTKRRMYPAGLFEAFEISDLFDLAVDSWSSKSIENHITGYAIFIGVVLKDPKYISSENYTAYHYLGHIYYEILKNIDFAIKLFSKGIELTPEEPSIIENRGFCFLTKNDLKNALIDFDRAKEIDGCSPDLADIIDDIKNRPRDFRPIGNFRYHYQLNMTPESLFAKDWEEVFEYLH